MNPNLIQSRSFRYIPCCSHPDCAAPATFKVAAEWSNGSFHELKTYSLACADHLAGLLEAAQRRRGQVRLVEGESLEPVLSYPLDPSKTKQGGTSTS